MIKYLQHLHNLKGKTVLLRADLDAPHDGEKILNDYRLRMAVPTIEFLRKRGAHIIILSKVGQPEGWDHTQSMLPQVERLAHLMDMKFVVHADRFPSSDRPNIVFFPHDIRETKYQQMLRDAPKQDIIVLENIRFYDEEKKDDVAFGKMLASFGELYVDDAFAVAHRAEASLTVIPHYLPSYAGLNFEKEITHLDKVFTLKKHPFVLLMGGAKISDKIGTIKFLGRQADTILIGGALSNLFFVAKGYDIGKSRSESDRVHLAKELFRNFKSKIVLPLDMVVADSESHQNIRIATPDTIKRNEVILDIGPKTIFEFSKYIKTAKKMVWNGPMGVFEQKPFAHGTMALALLFASRCKGRAFGVVGGGDTVEAIERAKVGEHIDFVSTSGGAMLDYLAGETLPGIKALESPHAKAVD